MATTSSLYAAYGSNMDPAQMILRCPRSPAAGTGWLDGWRLTFGGAKNDPDDDDAAPDQGALATIVEQPGRQVFVVLYELSPWDRDELDRWEAADIGAYRKLHVRVSTLDADVLAAVYVLDTYEGGLPSARYLAMIADAARAAGAPDDYVTDLMTRPCRPSD